jgi:hypothetical protein
VQHNTTSTPLTVESSSELGNRWSTATDAVSDLAAQAWAPSTIAAYEDDWRLFAA